MPTRDDAWRLLAEYVESDSLRKHCLAVETAMRAYAPVYGGDPDLWGMTGLLHDFDYEKFPRAQNREAEGTPDPETEEGHPFNGVRILRAQGYPGEMLRAILGHALYAGVPRVTPMEKALFACDELCGFLVACAYVRPERFEGMTVQSVEKSLRKKKFAEKVSREDIARGIAELGVSAERHIAFVAEALRANSAALGLDKK